MGGSNGTSGSRNSQPSRAAADAAAGGSGLGEGSRKQSTPGFIEKLLTKGWIEKSIIEGRLCYRITDQGLAAKKVPI
jgi:hypothetical protein